ncbi:adenine deaminase, partial [Peptostreptococcaceae bacterium OttesenSCG-928-C18]|nr:adenine deaminase [Peptostreptococcaceae bacterium OttesenSCG-928-C18]
MNKQELSALINAATGKIQADIVFKNCKIVDVYNHNIIEGNLGIYNGKILGIGDYEGKEEIDLKGKYIAPGFIDGHIHIESSYLSPEVIGSLLTPCGTTTIIADPHEIVNVCGLNGLDYMLEAAKETKLDIKFMLPSCVPATPFENSGANIKATDMLNHINNENILGLGEFMNFPGVVNADEEVVDKLLVAINNGKLIDGHSPGLTRKELNAYALTGVHNDHECSTVEEMINRIQRGMYVLLRQGSATNDLEVLLDGITEENSRRCVFCSDDRQPKTIMEEGHIDFHLRTTVKRGINPITAIQMASLNAAECFKLYDRGAIAPGLRADIVILEDLEDFKVDSVYISGEKVAENKKYLFDVKKVDNSVVSSSFNVKDFSKEKLKVVIPSRKANIIEIQEGGLVTKKIVEEININENDEFIYSSDKDIVKVAVVERHSGTGNVAVGLLKNYGIKKGAVALSIAHDSHNIIVVGVNDEDMEFAVNELISQNGGIILVNNQKIVESMPMPIGGIMSDQSEIWVDQKLIKIHEAALNELGINGAVEPVMTLCFMSLPVIPEIKITDMGLFDVNK